jgi:hypothetical protein
VIIKLSADYEQGVNADVETKSVALDGGLARLCEMFRSSWGSCAHNARAW